MFVVPVLDNKAYYIQLPKCANTSIVQSIGVLNGWDLGTDIQKRIKKHKKNIKKDRIKSLSEESFVFSFVRNPWDRFVSAYEYLKRGGIPYYDRTKTVIIKEEYPEFKDFVRAENVWKHWVFFWHQLDFVSIDGSIAMDFIGRFECLQSDFDDICDEINYPKVKLPYINKTKHAHYTEYYDDESIEIVGHLYKNDIEHFNYNFGD